MEKIANNIKNGTYKAVDVSNSKGFTSDVWKNFSRIYENDKPLDFAFCNACQKVCNYSRELGTNGLRKHKCMASQAANNLRINHLFPATRIDLSGSKKKFTMACTKFVAKDLRPFNIVAGDGFREIIQTAIEIGASRGQVNASEIIPHRKSLASNTVKMANQARENLIQHLQQNVSDGHCAMTTDLWTDDYKKLSYLALTVHYIDNEWQVQERVLCTKYFEQEKTGINIYSVVEECVQDAGFTSTKNIIFVTDRGANIVAAFKDDVRISCAAHLLNNVLETVFQKIIPTMPQLTHILQLLQTCRDLVGYFKRSGLMQKLDSTLKQVVDTRWNVHLSMLVSIKENFNKIKEVLPEPELYRIEGIDTAVIENLIHFLSPFKELTDIFEASKRPTLHRVVPCRRSLLDRLTSNPTDPYFIGQLKVSAKRLIDEKFSLHYLHRVALFLNPKMRSLKALDEWTERSETLNDVRNLLFSIRLPMLHVLDLSNDSSVPQLEHIYSSDSGARPAKRKKTGFEEVWEDDDNVVQAANTSIDAEMETYKNLPVPEEAEFDLLRWWKNQSVQLPRMAQLAKRVLCIPATSAPSERNFSAAGLLIDKLRTSLKPKNVNDLLLLRSNFDLIS